MGSPSRNVQYHPPRLSEDRLNLPQPHSPSLPTHCSGKSGMRPRRVRLVRIVLLPPVRRPPPGRPAKTDRGPMVRRLLHDHQRRRRTERGRSDASPGKQTGSLGARSGPLAGVDVQARRRKKPLATIFRDRQQNQMETKAWKARSEELRQETEAAGDGERVDQNAGKPAEPEPEDDRP